MSAARRHIELLKAPGASIPNRLLSHAASAVTDEEVQAQQQQVGGVPI